MSTQCNRFEQNAWKKELCSNCFKPREEHEDSFKMNTGRLLTQSKSDSPKLQGILRDVTISERDQRRKKVAFPECLTEIIGYGGDDVLSDAEEEDEQGFEESFSTEEDMAPDSEEERALGNLTRFNTNFNTITANLTEVVSTNEANKSSATRSFASLMLGRIQKDSEGRKTTLLVSVTPFGGDETLPTAKRPTDRKTNVNGFNTSTKCKATENSVTDSKPEITLKIPKKIEVDQKKTDKPEQKYSSGLEKIVDMPLITSSNLIPVIQRNESTENDGGIVEKSNSENTQRSQDLKTEKKVSASSRPPPIKKPDNEKPKVALQPLQNGARNEYDFVTTVAKRPLEISRSEEESSPHEKGIELILAPLSKSETDDAAESDRAMIIRGKDVNKITVIAADNKKNAEDLSPSQLRNVEGEDRTSEKKFSFEESRELAGEPDGKADEEEITEPPALPRSPPPIEARPPLPGETSKPSIVAMEPRPSFLHGVISTDVKIKPAVPQKPVTFIAKSIVPPDLSNKKSLTSTFTASTFQSPANRIAQNIPQESNILLRPTFKGKSDEIANPGVDPSQGNDPQKEADLHRTQTTTTANNSTVCSGTPQKLASYKPKPPPLNLTRNQADGGDGSENPEVDEDLLEGQLAGESIRSTNKRRMAPKPPAVEATEDLAPSSSLFARNPGASLKSDSPVVREKEKRERASSCSPKFRKAVSELPDPTSSVQTPDPVSRRTISLSQDSLATGPEVREEKKRGRSRFSLKRFLRMGSRKDVDMVGSHGSNSRIDEIPSTPQPKPRLEIIHPLELDGAAVEVVGNDRVARISEDQIDSGGSRNDNGRSTRSPPSTRSQQAAVRPGKPPPPPRNQSLEDWSRLDPVNKPVRPPPPRVDTKQLPPRSEKSSSKSSSTSSSSWQPATSPSSDSIYANLAAEDVTGEVRSSLAPSKPQRTASMRDQAASQPLLKKHAASTQALNQDYEAVASSDSPTSNDTHVYECLSSSPECDSNLELRRAVVGSGGVPHLTCKRKSDSSAMESAMEFKFHHQPFVRSTSLPYCGSETESELYAPYAFYTGDEGPEEDQDWKSKEDELRISRLRQRRGRSIVHRSLEDNYGAVVVANHEALAQFLEQLNQVPQVPAGLRTLKNGNPRLSHFNVDANSSIVLGRRIFYSAMWNEQNVSLCIAFDLAAHVSRKEFYLAPVVQFVDSVPKEFLDNSSFQRYKDLTNKDAEANISVLPRLQVNSVQSFGASTKGLNDEGAVREASFVMLQFVNALKSLQARGIEEAPKSLSNVVLCREEKDACHRLYLLQGLNTDTVEERDEECVSLCQCALVALEQLNLPERLPVVRELLTREKAVTLSQVKSLLEFSLWGPADVSFGGPREREVSLQRWLDLERANVLHALVKTRTPLTVTDEYQLLFLVRTSAKIMSEASLLLDDQRARLARMR